MRIIISGIEDGTIKEVNDLKNYLRSHEWNFKLES